MKRPAGKLQLQIVCVRPVARHQCETTPSIVIEEDISGLYERINATTLYCAAASRFVELGREAMAKALEGAALRVTPAAIS